MIRPLMMSAFCAVLHLSSATAPARAEAYPFIGTWGRESSTPSEGCGDDSETFTISREKYGKCSILSVQSDDSHVYYIETRCTGEPKHTYIVYVDGGDLYERQNDENDGPTTLFSYPRCR